jgi:myosin heavy subunit
MTSTEALLTDLIDSGAYAPTPKQFYDSTKALNLTQYFPETTPNLYNLARLLHLYADNEFQKIVVPRDLEHGQITLRLFLEQLQHLQSRDAPKTAFKVQDPAAYVRVLLDAKKAYGDALEENRDKLNSARKAVKNLEAERSRLEKANRDMEENQKKLNGLIEQAKAAETNAQKSLSEMTKLKTDVDMQLQETKSQLAQKGSALVVCQTQRAESAAPVIPVKYVDPGKAIIDLKNAIINRKVRLTEESYDEADTKKYLNTERESGENDDAYIKRLEKNLKAVQVLVTREAATGSEMQGRPRQARH